MTSHAFQQASRTGIIDGPLQGYHREWYVVRPDGELTDLGRVKVGEPRRGIPWFDRRFFPSEDELLLRLADIGTLRIPPTRRLDSLGLVVHGFVEGQTLGAICPAGARVEEECLSQIMSVFDDLARVHPDTVLKWGIGKKGLGEGDSRRFLQDLVRFTRRDVYETNLGEFGTLFDELRVPRDALGPDSWLMSEAGKLSTRRPFCLLHGDLHRANFIVDPDGRLWTIDWELAALGDPLYDLATHLHLMGYPPDQEREVVRRWRAVMSEALPGATHRLDADLPRYLAYKRAQSVFTDVVRHAIAVRDAETPTARAAQLQRSSTTVKDVIERARSCLKPVSVPDVEQVGSALAGFASRAGDEVPSPLYAAAHAGDS